MTKLDTTPTQAEKAQRHTIQGEKTPTLEKSASRNLLLKRDRSQLIGKTEEYQSNKSPKPTTQKDLESVKENTITRKHNFADQSANRRLIGSRQKSLGKSPMQTPKDLKKVLKTVD